MADRDTVIYGYSLRCPGDAGLYYRGKPVSTLIIELWVKCYNNELEDDAREIFDYEPGVYDDKGELISLSDLFGITIEEQGSIQIKQDDAIADLFKKICGWDEIECDIADYEVITDKRMTIDDLEFHDIISSSPSTIKGKPFDAISIRFANDPDDSAHIEYLEDTEDFCDFETD